MTKPQDQDAALEKAFRDGTLPEADRRAAEARGVVFSPNADGRMTDADGNVPSAGPFQGRTLAQIHGEPAPDLRTIAEIAAGVPAPIDELERLLGLAENETGYAQKQAVTDLRKLLGRPKGSQREIQVVAAQAQHEAFADVRARHARGEITASARDAALANVSKQQDATLIADQIDRDERHVSAKKKVPVDPRSADEINRGVSVPVVVPVVVEAPKVVPS